MKKNYFISILLLSFCFLANANKYHKTDLGIKSTVNNTEIEIQVFSPSIIRVIKSTEGHIYKGKSFRNKKTIQNCFFCQRKR